MCNLKDKITSCTHKLNMIQNQGAIVLQQTNTIELHYILRGISEHMN